ncbi:hypothetical protein M0208_10630 [Sphingomonas sp. SUN019]|uniref:hypothetical protein n=1 Tax=Sphingomonas sp. SUN019 TaxID=2937788 RepID=UPI002164E52A|nr:hypothetical protein [Sphingomonas sp. SUN019]UVO50949.1 hypothetical protein M0208_10630 [Sphingomonas sp. SUN019]
MVLTRGDDYPIHQTADPIAYAGTDRNFYDRYYFNGYAPGVGEDGFFAAALGVYPHLNVIDASFCWLMDGKQVNLHASRGLAMERMDTQVGPIRIEVIEPLKKLRITVDAPDQGMRADLTITGRAFPLEEPRFTRRNGPRVLMDVTRLTQNGSYAGWVEVDGARTDVTGWIGTRDRSWGVRPIGAPDAQPPNPPIVPQFFWLWAPCAMEGGDLYFHTNDDEHGRLWNRRAAWRPLGGGIADEHHYDAANYEVRWRQGSRQAQAAGLTLTAAHGKTRVEFDIGQTFMMLGLGYGHPTWGHGRAHEGEAVEREDFVVADLDPMQPHHLHIQASVGVTMTLPDGTVRRGKGVLEQLAIGPHAPSGFTGLLDPA